MRLLSITNRYYLGLLIILLMVWSALFYWVLQYEVYENVDEVLAYRKNLLVDQIKKNGELPIVDQYHDFVIMEVNNVPPNFKDAFQDTLVHKWRKSFDEYRRITSYFELNEKFYRVSYTLPHMEHDEMIETMAYTLPIFLAMLLIGYSVMVTQLNKRVWRPFYSILSKFNAFSLESAKGIDFDHASVKEFRELQQGVKDLTDRSINSYLQQKQFTENASHEIQTPLAIIQAKLELLLQDAVTQRQSEILEDVFLAVDRLSKINETLLLLTKIENNQFPEKSEIKIKPVIEDLLPYFDEQASKYNIQVNVEIENDESLETNGPLFSILIANLLKNAFVHNLLNGKIRICTKARVLEISNTGPELNVKPEKLFERFYTQAAGKGGAGLGLALVKGICTINHWGISYTQTDGLHKIVIDYSEVNNLK
ncbi:MAG TPA: HAMP domain-containing sensor histidine kinase [Cyclobacteriaceae bacterium]|jgi:signal transduction histidine kinase|nr:HAMP domain-containing sensor histidine kinase [Cyclobacteriaceae bacterium]